MDTKLYPWPFCDQRGLMFCFYDFEMLLWFSNQSFCIPKVHYGHKELKLGSINRKPIGIFKDYQVFFPSLLLHNKERFLAKEPIKYQSIVADCVPCRDFKNRIIKKFKFRNKILAKETIFLKTSEIH